jgi:hypothetical protein
MVGVIYRPPHSDVSYWQKFENNIQPILDLNIPVILGGDLNIDMLGNQCGTRFDINVYTDWAVVTAKVRGNFNIKNKIWSVCNK